MKVLFVAIVFSSFVFAAAPTELYSIGVKSLEGQKSDLSAYRNKALVIVNTASRCGYTPQYEGLQKLQQQYQDRGVVVLGFPSNDFGAQEPGTNKEIRQFCKQRFGVTFPLFDKAPVTGTAIQPVYAWLVQNAPTHEPVEWNFEKFVVNRQGKVVSRFKSTVTPDSAELKNAIEQALASK